MTFLKGSDLEVVKNHPMPINYKNEVSSYILFLHSGLFRKWDSVLIKTYVLLFVQFRGALLSTHPGKCSLQEEVTCGSGYLTSKLVKYVKRSF